jgi:putative transposase
MKEWFSLSEIAGSPNMPSKVSGVRRKAERECWQLRDRQAVGGGKEYHWASFSEETKAFLTDKFGDFSTIVEVAALIDEDAKSQPLEKLEELPELLGDSEELADHVVDGNKNAGDKAFEMPVESDKSTAVTLARLKVVQMAQKYLMDRKAISPKVKKVACYEEFAEKVEAGEIELPEFVRIGLTTAQGKLKLSRASLTNWEGQSLKELAPKHQGKESFFDLRPDYAIAAEAVSREFGAAAKILQHAFESGLIKEHFGLEECPTYSQIVCWLKKQEEINKQRQRAFRTGDKSVLLPALGSYSRGLLPNQKWEIDSTKADLATKKENVVWLSSPFGEAPVRAALVACIDVATRMVKVLVRPTSNSEALCLVLAECVKDWGLPKLVKTDNGKDYISKHVKGFLTAMGIEQKCCVVRQPWEKPHIERFMRTLQHSAEWQMLPWSTGHSVAMQQALRKRRDGDLVLPWTIAEFQDWIDKWVDSYHSRVHEGLGISPMARLASFRADGFVALMPKNLEETLLFAMMREDTVTVNKGGISYQGRLYVATELISHFGEKLAIRIDPDDVNQILVYSTTDLSKAQFICKAKWDVALSTEEQARIASAKPAIAQAVKEHEQAVKSARSKIKREVAKNPERLIRGGGVAALKSVQEIESTSTNLIKQIEAAAAPKVQSIDPEMDERWKAVLAKREEDAKPSEILVRTAEQWLMWWDKPELASEDDLRWMIHTAGMAGYGKAWLTMRRVDVDDAIEILEKRIGDRAA